jgi:hypothetical protein
MRPFSIPELLEVVEEQRNYAPRGADLTLVLGLTGLRFGELRGLRVRDVLDVPYPALRVSRSVPASGGGGRPIVEDEDGKGQGCPAGRRSRAGGSGMVRRQAADRPSIHRSAGQLDQS